MGRHDGEARLELVAGAWLVGTFTEAGWIEVRGPDGVARVASGEAGSVLRLGPLPPGAHEAKQFRMGAKAPYRQQTLALRAGEELRVDG